MWSWENIQLLMGKWVIVDLAGEEICYHVRTIERPDKTEGLVAYLGNPNHKGRQSLPISPDTEISVLRDRYQ